MFFSSAGCFTKKKTVEILHSVTRLLVQERTAPQNKKKLLKHLPRPHRQAPNKAASSPKSISQLTFPNFKYLISQKKIRTK